MRGIGLPKVFGFYAIMAGVAVVAMWRRGHLDTFGPGLDWLDWARALGGGIGAGLLMVVASRAATARFDWAAQLAEEFRGLIGRLHAREAFAVALMSGIAEETLFRGVLQPALGLWLTAAIFGVLHIGPNKRFLPWTAMAFVAGLVFGGLFAWTGNLLAPILAHITVNFLNLRFLAPADIRDEVHLKPMGGEHVAGHASELP
jgi:membrane protease YdiL (CAAX protease family)